MCCAYRDGIRQTLVASSVCLCTWSLSMISNQPVLISGPWHPQGIFLHWTAALSFLFVEPSYTTPPVPSLTHPAQSQMLALQRSKLSLTTTKCISLRLCDWLVNSPCEQAFNVGCQEHAEEVTDIVKAGSFWDASLLSLSFSTFD